MKLKLIAIPILFLVGYMAVVHFFPPQPDWPLVRAKISSILARPGWDFGSIAPILLRLGWHTSGTYNKTDRTGGSNGATMRFTPEASDPANAGLENARAFLEVVKKEFPDVSYSDLWVLSAYVAIEHMGGPIIEFVPGRTDAMNASACPANGRLPDGSKNRTHIREIFNRMGFEDREIVALIGGGHGVGKCHTNFTEYEGPWTTTPINFTNNFFTELLYENWTVKSWAGEKQYEDSSKTLMMMPTDLELRDDPEFYKWSELYVNNQTVFFEDFSRAYKKLTELGFRQF